MRRPTRESNATAAWKRGGARKLGSEGNRDGKRPLIGASWAQVQCAVVAEGDSSGFGMTVRIVVIAVAVFALLWFAIDSNRFHWTPRATSPVSAASRTTTTTPRP